MGQPSFVIGERFNTGKKRVIVSQPTPQTENHEPQTYLKAQASQACFHAFESQDPEYQSRRVHGTYSYGVIVSAVVLLVLDL